MSRVRHLAPTLLIFIFFQFINPSNAIAVNYEVIGTEAKWEWQGISDRINELTIYERNADGTYSYIDTDGFDGFGRVQIGGTIFNTSGSIPTDGNKNYTDSDHPGDTVNYQFQDNWWQISVSLDSAADIRIDGNLGSDSGTTWVTIDGMLFSYQRGSEAVSNDPIFYWSRIPSTYADGNDQPVWSATGATSLVLKLHAYAHRADNTVDRADYMEKLALFASENINRTDIFDYRTWSPVPAVTPAPAPVYVRQSSNLSFAQSLYASDTLSDPDGELRKTVDQIMNKYGKLIE